MDASDRGKHSGNGKHVPAPGSLPSAAVVPQGAPVSSSPAGEAPAGSPPAGPPRDEKGRILPGYSLNPKGKPPGIPNRNAELAKLLNTKELRETWEIAKARAKRGETGLMEFLLDRVLIKLSPEAAGLVLNVNQSNQQTHNQTNVHLEQYDRLLGDGQGRDLLAALAQRAAACGAFSGDARHVRQ